MSRKRLMLRHLSGTLVAVFLFAFAFLGIATLAPTAILWDHFNDAANQNQNEVGQAILFSVVVFLAFGAFGTLVLTTGIKSWRDDAERKELSTAYPNQPWFWKEDWLNESVRHSNVLRATYASTLAIMTIALSWGLVGLMHLSGDWPATENRTKSLGMAILILPFCSVGLGMGLYAVTQWIQHLRWGESILELATIPSHPGGPLIGLIQLRRSIPSTARVSIVTTCYAQRLSGRSSGNASNTGEWYQATVYQSRKTFARQGSSWNSDIPIWIDIPEDAIASNPDRQTHWELSVRIDDHWHRYAATFTVPVFRVVDAKANSKLAVTPAKQAWCTALAEQKVLLGDEDIGSVIERFGGTVIRNSTDSFEILLPLDSTPWGLKEATAVFTAIAFFGWGLIMPGWQRWLIIVLPITVIALMAYRRIKKQRLVLTRDQMGYHRPTFRGLRWTEHEIDDIQSIGAWFDDRSNGSMLEEQVMLRTRSNQRITILRGLPDRWVGTQIASRLRMIRNQSARDVS